MVSVVSDACWSYSWAVGLSSVGVCWLHVDVLITLLGHFLVVIFFFPTADLLHCLSRVLYVLLFLGQCIGVFGRPVRRVPSGVVLLLLIPFGSLRILFDSEVYCG